MLVTLGALAAPADVDAPVGRRMRWWPWKRLRRAGFAAVPVGAREDVGRDAMLDMDVLGKGCYV